MNTATKYVARPITEHLQRTQWQKQKRSHGNEKITNIFNFFFCPKKSNTIISMTTLTGLNNTTATGDIMLTTEDNGHTDIFTEQHKV